MKIKELEAQIESMIIWAQANQHARPELGLVMDFYESLSPYFDDCERRQLCADGFEDVYYDVEERFNKMVESAEEALLTELLQKKVSKSSTPPRNIKPGLTPRK